MSMNNFSALYTMPWMVLDSSFSSKGRGTGRLILTGSNVIWSSCREPGIRSEG